MAIKSFYQDVYLADDYFISKIMMKIANALLDKILKEKNMLNESEEIFKIYNEAKNKILLYVQAAVPPEQFKALRKLILDELGLSGAQGKIKKLFEQNRRISKDD